MPAAYVDTPQTNPHTQDGSSSLLCRRYHLRADRRSAAMVECNGRKTLLQCQPCTDNIMGRSKNLPLITQTATHPHPLEIKRPTSLRYLPIRSPPLSDLRHQQVSSRDGEEVQILPSLLLIVCSLTIPRSVPYSFIFQMTLGHQSYFTTALQISTKTTDATSSL